MEVALDSIDAGAFSRIFSFEGLGAYGLPPSQLQTLMFSLESVLICPNTKTRV